MFRRRIRSLVFDASQSVPLSRPSSGAMRRSAVSPLSALPFLFSISFFFSLCASERVAASLNLSFCAYLSSPFFRFFPLVTLAFPKVSSSIKIVFLFPLFLFILPFCLSYKPFCNAFLCNIDSFCFLFEFVGFSVIFSFLTCFYRSFPISNPNLFIFTLFIFRISFHVSSISGLFKSPFAYEPRLPLCIEYVDEIASNRIFKPFVIFPNKLMLTFLLYI